VIVQLHDGAGVDLNGAGFGTPDALLRIDPAPLFLSYCSGDGGLPTACPCANFGLAGKGCENSSGTGGAFLAAAGTTTPDTVVLSASDMLSSALHIYLQGNGNNASGVVFGDGVRCAAGQLLRLVVKNAVNGASEFPRPGDPSITEISAQLGAPIAPGSLRYYQTYYRDPVSGFCPAPPGNSWNVTNGVRIHWQ
jgi:hypothetical protein